MQSVQVATAPLSDNVLKTILPKGQVVSDTRRLLKYFRIAEDGRLLMGGRGGVSNRGTSIQIKNLKHSVKEMFPFIGEIKYDYSWGGNVALTLNHFPQISVFKNGIKTNCTLIFSAAQALLAAKAGATYVSPFIGRLDDVNEDGLGLIKSIRTIYDNYNFETNILAASIRSKEHINKCAEIGADFATIPYSLLNQLFDHPLTTKGLEIFLADHAKLNP